MKAALRFCLLCLLCWATILPASAQETRTTRWFYTGLELDYPADWEAIALTENSNLSLNGDGIFIDFYAPRNDDSPADLIATLQADNEGIFTFGDAEEIELLDSAALRIGFTDGEITGFSVALAYNDQMLLLDAYVEDEELGVDTEAAILAILATLRPTDAPKLAYSYETPEEVLADLTSLGLDLAEGAFLFRDESLSGERDEPEVLSVSPYSGGRIIIGGTLRVPAVEGDEAYQQCGFIVQSSSEDVMAGDATFLAVGLDTDNDIFLNELNNANQDNDIFDSYRTGLYLDEDSYFVLALYENAVDVFVTGELLVEAWELGASAGDGELFAGIIAGIGCEMSDLWAYTFE